MRKQNQSVYEISEELESPHIPLSPMAAPEFFKQEGFAPLPRRLDEERPFRLCPRAEYALRTCLALYVFARRRMATLVREIAALPRSAWSTINLDVPTRKYKTPLIHEQMVNLTGGNFLQIFIRDLGHDEPTHLVTNDQRSSAPKHIARYAQRMLIENALSDAVRFFHMDALSSAVGLKADFDMTLLVIAISLYRLMAKRMRDYAKAQARQVARPHHQGPMVERLCATLDHVSTMVTARVRRILVRGNPG